MIALGRAGRGRATWLRGSDWPHASEEWPCASSPRPRLVHELMEARDERRLMRLQKQLANHKLLIIDELGFVPAIEDRSELLFELVSQRYERAAVLITSNLPFDEWTETFGSSA